MLLKRTTMLMLAIVLALTTMIQAVSAQSAEQTVITLSDAGVTVDGQAASTDASSAVYTGADIVYYESGRGSSYGEGTESDAHSAEEASAHTVVTITEPGTYRVSGQLSKGQLAIDLGKEAASDPDARVTLILDGADITSTVAPGVIFYNVYEPYSDTEDTKGVVDLSKAGAQVIIADGTVNTVNGSYVAKIYKEGTTSKLHKYDGAFYSKMSMNISGGAAGTGELRITAAKEGLNSELHLALNSGNVYISAQDDGINTNEDGISVTSINGGYLYVNAGLGAEGDGIDSNGYLTVNGGTIVTMSNERSPDGGIDADKAILINGGTVTALGTRNDAVSQDSKQTYMELAFASTQAAGSVVALTDADGNEIFSHTAEKAFQSITFSSSQLKLDTEYHLYVNGVQQQYTGNASGMMGGGGNRPQDGGPGEGNRPETGGMNGPAPTGNPPTGDFTPPANTNGTEPDGAAANVAGSTAFIVTEAVSSFSGISQASDASGKTRVSFTVNNGAGIRNAATGQQAVLEQIAASADVPEQDIQVTVTDVPSENYSETKLLSELKGSLSDIMPEADGQYRLTVAVVSTNETYTGVSQWLFTIGGLPFTDLNPADPAYQAVKALYDKGLMVGTGSSSFSPTASVTRAMAITTLGRLLRVEAAESSAFNDVAAGSWYSGYVGWAAENGIVVGNGKGLFLPNQPLTAEQMGLILSRYAELANIELSIDELLPDQEEQSLTRAELAIVLNELL